MKRLCRAQTYTSDTLVPLMNTNKQLTTPRGFNLVKYALARMHGATRGEAAIAAGSKATSPDNANATARNIEEHADFPEALAIARTLWSRASLPALEQAQAAMVRDLESADWKCRHSAAEWLRKLHGKGSTTTHEMGESFFAVLAAASNGTAKRTLPSATVTTKALPSGDDDTGTM